MAQLVGLLMPPKYIKAHKIKEITEVKINTNDSMPETSVYYRNGLRTYRSSYSHRSRFENYIDSNYSKEYLRYYEYFFYDSTNRIILSAASWDGFKSPQILITESKYSVNRDSIFSQGYSSYTGKLSPSSRELVRFAKDTVLIEDHKYALIGYNGDTLAYKLTYKVDGCDSTIYLYDSETNPYYYKYEVYKDDLLKAVGTALFVEEDSLSIVNNWVRYTFDKQGFPTKGVEYWYRDNSETQIKVTYQVYKK